MRCFSVTRPRTFPEPLHSSASHGVSTAECFGFSNGAKTSTVWRLWPSVFTVSLNTMSSNEKSSNIPFCCNFHLLGGGISFCFNPHRSVQPGPRTLCLFRWPGPTPLHSSFLSAWSVCPHALPTYPSVCPIPHISTRDRALKDVSTFTVSKLSYLFYCCFVSAGEEFGFFPCCAFTCRIWNHQTWKTSVEYFTKK